MRHRGMQARRCRCRLTAEFPWWGGGVPGGRAGSGMGGGGWDLTQPPPLRKCTQGDRTLTPAPAHKQLKIPHNPIIVKVVLRTLSEHVQFSEVCRANCRALARGQLSVWFLSHRTQKRSRHCRRWPGQCYLISHTMLGMENEQ